MLFSRHFSAAVVAALIFCTITPNHSFAKLALPAMGELLPSAKQFGKDSLSKFTSMFGTYVHQEMIEREYALDNMGSLTISNTEGNITVELGPHPSAIDMRIQKKASNPEFLPSINIQETSTERNNKSHLTLTTVYTGERTRGSMNYTLRVPANLSLHLRTGTGTITISNISGKIIAQTARGKIDIQGTTGTVLAQTEQKGDIYVEHAQGDVKTIVNSGNIRIQNATKSVIASAEKGTISASIETLNPNTLLEFHTQSGNVNLALPSTASAHIQGHTESGSFTSTHWIKVNTFTTQLNKKAWSQFKRGVEGSIGTEGSSEIRLTSINGNIKITESSTATS